MREDEVRALYAEMLEREGRGARVKAFLPIFTYRAVRKELKDRHPLQGNGTPNGEVPGVEQAATEEQKSETSYSGLRRILSYFI